MNEFEFSSWAALDLAEILAYRADKFGADSAADLEDGILEACERLAETPGLGHRRSDLTPLPYFFYAYSRYLIVYAREIDPLPILAIVHSSRNVRQILRARFRKQGDRTSPQ